MPVKYRIFRGVLASWETLFDEAAAFATELGPGNVLSISHSADSGDGVVTVWYWTKGEGEEEPDHDSPPGEGNSWACPHCGESNPGTFAACGSCRKPRDLA